MREAVENDIPNIVDMGVRFHAMSPWAHVEYNPKDAANIARFLIEGDSGAIFIVDGGMLGALCYPLYFNKDYIICQELFWWSENKKGKHVLDAFEQWSKTMGANAIQMTCLANDKEQAARRLLRMGGYDAREIGLYKDI